jgi:hypothetical protein
MNFNNALTAYDEATTEAEVRAAYAALVEHVAADEDLDEDACFESGVDTFLNETGRLSFSEKLLEFRYSDVLNLTAEETQEYDVKFIEFQEKEEAYFKALEEEDAREAFGIR